MSADDPRPAGETGISECTALCKPVPDGPINGHWHDLGNGQKWVWAMYPPSRPAASGGATDGERRACPGGPFHCTCPAPSAAPVVSQADEELRDVFRRFLFWGVDTGKAGEAAAGLVALPAVQRLLAAAAAVQRVRGFAEQWDDMARDHDEQGFIWVAGIYRAHARHLRRALGDQP